MGNSSRTLAWVSALNVLVGSGLIALYLAERSSLVILALGVVVLAGGLLTLSLQRREDRARASGRRDA